HRGCIRPSPSNAAAEVVSWAPAARSSSSGCPTSHRGFSPGFARSPARRQHHLSTTWHVDDLRPPLAPVTRHVLTAADRESIAALTDHLAVEEDAVLVRARRG